MAQWIGNNFGSLSADNTAKNHTVYQPDLSKHGQAYRGLAEANPYSNVSYRQSWIQKVLQNLGFRTNYDSYLEGMSLQAKEYDNALLQKEYDENYNSPLQQAMREQAAGVNPDLVGNVGPGEASQMKDDGNPPVPPEANDLEQITGFASSVIQGVQMAYSLASGVTDLTSRVLDNRSKRMNQITQEDQLAFQALLNILPPESDEPLNYNQLYAKFKNAYAGHFRKRYFPNFVQRAYEFQNSLAFTNKEFETKNTLSSNRSSYYGRVSSPAYSDENKVMRAVSGVLSDLAYKSTLLFAKMDARKADIEGKRLDVQESELANDKYYQDNVRPVENANKLKYAQNLDTAKLAKNEGTSSDLDVRMKANAVDEGDYQKLLRSSYKELLQKLDMLEDDGSWYAPYVKMAISALIMNNLPHMGITVNTGARTYNFEGK